jgi:hypothetical protein
MISKPIVEYLGEPFFQHMGENDNEKPMFIARVYCINHPILGSQDIRTSLIISRNLDNGDFETRNTIYRQTV